MTVLTPPSEVLEIADVLERAGFETWCVGGAVRDALLGHAHLDWDLATSATPVQVRSLFRRTVPVGIEHGTIGVLDRHGVMHEVTTFRRDVRTDGRHAEVEFGVSLDDDLARRDFTINAIAWSPARQELRDPFGGQRDLAAGVVRAVGDAPARMREDRLRALRAIRFAARFTFRIEPATWAAVAASAPELKRLSPERVRQELEKTLDQVRRPSEALGLWQQARFFDELLVALSGVNDVTIRSTDCLAQPGLAGRPQRRSNRMAALHIELGGRRAAAAMKAMRASNSDVKWVAELAERWGTLGADITAAAMGPSAPPDADVRRWVAALGRTRVSAFLRVAAARWGAARALGRPAPTVAAVRALYRAAHRVAWNDPVELADLAVDGDDLRGAGITAGPQLGKALETLLGWVLDDPSRNTRDTLMARARTFAAPGDNQP